MLIQDSLPAESLCKCVLDTHLKRKNCWLRHNASNQVNKQINRLCLVDCPWGLILWHLIWVYNVWSGSTMCVKVLYKDFVHTNVRRDAWPSIESTNMSCPVRATSFIIWKEFCAWSLLLLRYNVAQYYQRHIRAEAADYLRKTYLGV